VSFVKDADFAGAAEGGRSRSLTKISRPAHSPSKRWMRKPQWLRSR